MEMTPSQEQLAMFHDDMKKFLSRWEQESDLTTTEFVAVLEYEKFKMLQEALDTEEGRVLTFEFEDDDEDEDEGDEWKKQ